ncbi:MAG: 30S ribosomal protein S20 [Acidobacteriia bacterium]|nr:30S ribosomal protein S20 [Terriglobia bacterium]
MASHKSALKKHRQDEKRRVRNRQHASRLRTQVKKFRKAVASGDEKAARELLPETLSLIDRTAKLGVLHANAAARSKSRATLAVNKLSSPTR